MSWDQSLIRISTYEVEVLQKRLADIADRRARLEMELAVLEAEGEAEMENARRDAIAGWYHAGFAEGLKLRKSRVQEALAGVALEEQGARDALNAAFETQKKYEHVADGLRRARVREAQKREAAAMDELGLRRAAAR